MDAVWGNAPAPNELLAALRQMSLGKAAAEDEVTAELLKFGGDNLWEAVVRVCREQWMLLSEAAPGAEVSWFALLTNVSRLKSRNLGLPRDSLAILSTTGPLRGLPP